MNSRTLSPALIGAITVMSPVILFFGFLYLVSGHHDSLLFGNRESGNIGPFAVFFIIDWAILIGIYLVHSSQNASLTKAEKDKWRMRFCWFAYFAMISYWYSYIWKPIKNSK